MFANKYYVGDLIITIDHIENHRVGMNGEEINGSNKNYKLHCTNDININNRTAVIRTNAMQTT